MYALEPMAHWNYYYGIAHEDSSSDNCEWNCSY